jgi:hypothetical protein
VRTGLGKLKAAVRAEPEASEVQAASGDSQPFGRKGWPPAPGSGYDAFLEWACEGERIPNDGDAALATALFCGLVEHPGEQSGGTPQPRL